MLTRKEKKTIQNKQRKLTAKQIAQELNIEMKVVEEYLASSPSTVTPKWFYLVLILMPILLLLLLELSLRIFDYGKTYDQWVKAGEGKLTLPPEIAYRYFYTTEDQVNYGSTINQKKSIPTTVGINSQMDK